MTAIDLVLTALLMSQAAAPPAAEPGTPPSEVVGPQQTRPDRMVCRLEEQTSSRLNRPRTCRRESEWARDRDERQRDVAQRIGMAESQQFANRPVGPDFAPPRPERGNISRCGLRGPC